ncbi:PDDEXK nuclease domain-containing protein [Clostridium sp. Mt-5]|uniref:PDDEXK nuclease domain-containing protein n=1 Tax=Clostridium moutaii TaxID=3240932 RepID=A0ABV4BPF4_9CLOT
MIENYNDIDKFLENLRNDVISSKNRSLITVNKNMFMLYWEIGNLILIRQNKGCGSEFISILAQYFKAQFPNKLSFSEKNLKNMVKFAGEYESQNFVENVASRISWSCNMVLVDRIKNVNKRVEYMNEALEKGWNLETLARKIDLQYGIVEDNGEEVTEEETTNEEVQSVENKDIITSEVDNPSKGEGNEKKEAVGTSPFIKDIISNEDAGQLSEDDMKNYFSALKDEYLIDFMNDLNEEKEKCFQEQFIKYTMEFFLELNSGFALVGNRYHMELSGGDYYVDLLFYNLKLKRYVAVELKVGKFKPEYLGILTFHLSILDDSVKNKDDNSSIGIIICKEDEKLIVQYAFKDVEESEDAEYRLNEDIPQQYQDILPTVEEIGCGIKSKLKSA